MIPKDNLAFVSLPPVNDVRVCFQNLVTEYAHYLPAPDSLLLLLPGVSTDDR